MRTRTRLVVAGMLFFSATLSVFAADVPPATRADLLSYHESHLPDPIVIYAYDAQGRLLDVFGKDGNNGIAMADRVLDLISSGSLPASPEHGLAEIDGSFKAWLSDSGLALDDLIDKRRAFSLVLAIPDTGTQPCPPCEQYQRILADATRSPAAKGRFAWHVLSLGSPMLKFRTAN